MSLGLTEMIVLLVIVLVFFGAGKLPTVMGDLAKGVRSFKQGLRGDADESAPAAEPDRLASGRASEPQHNAPPTLLPSPGKAAGETRQTHMISHLKAALERGKNIYRIRR